MRFSYPVVKNTKFTPHKVALSSHDLCPGGLPAALGVTVGEWVALAPHPAEAIFTVVMIKKPKTLW